MSAPDPTARLVRRHTADIEALYELTAGIDRKVDALATEMDRRLEVVDRRFDGVDQRFDGVDERLLGINAQLAEILRRLQP